MSRLAPLAPPYAAELREQFDRIMRGAPPLLLFRTIARSPRAWQKFTAGQAKISPDTIGIPKP